MKKLLHWFNNSGLYVIALFLLAFIPLYPKLPLIDITHTWVSIRLEDFFVAFAVLVLLVVKLRDKEFLKSPLSFPFLVYFAVIFLSLVNALLFIFPQLTSQLFPHLALLHFLRRIEYISVFFLAFEAFRKKPKLWGVIAVLTGTYALVLLYGVGQKFLGFPAFLTMNEEFAKGIPLRLPSTARIPSTFGGHYDLGAFLVFTIPIIGSMVFTVRKWYMKALYGMLWVGGLIVLLFTASRISFGVYLVAITTMLVWQKKKMLILPVILLSILVLNLTSGASERFYKTFRFSDVIVDLSTGKPVGTLEKLEGGGATVQKSESPAEESLPTGSEFISIPKRSGSTNESPEEEKKEVQKITFVTSQDLKKGTGEVATVSGSFLIQKALVYDISITTRLQGQWPMAMKAFTRNIFLGSGLSSVSLAADGDYHRMLGETGLLGAIAFLGIFITAYAYFFRLKDTVDQISRGFAIGVFAGLTGLFFNAVLIDVFEASKVAFTLWLVLGFCLSALVWKQQIAIPYFPLLKNVFTHRFSYYVYLIICVFVIWGGALSLYFLGDDFTWTRWASQSSMKDIIGYFTQAQGFFYRPVPKMWYFLLFSVFWLKPFMYHVASLTLVSMIAIVLYVYLKEKGIPGLIAWISAFVFVSLSIHHENIFWISGQSSLLSSVFLMVSLLLFHRAWAIVQKHSVSLLLTIGGSIAVFFSMLSYDGTLPLPLILFVLSLLVYKKGWSMWWILLLMPLYWMMRTSAGAVVPSGDYGYKWTTFFVNSIGNGIGYASGIMIGPKALEYMGVVRSMLKQYVLPVSLVALVCSLGCFGLVVRFRNHIRKFQEPLLFILFAVLASVSYLGLGNTAERYTIIPSLFVSIGSALFVTLFLRTSKSIFWKSMLVFIAFIVVVWNIGQIKRLEGDWKKASTIAESALLSVRTEIYPPKNDDLVIVFVNLPIRYGRAWIFPAGINDALWHMFRENLYGVYTMPTLEAAYDLKTDKGTRYVYVFEDYVLKKGVKKTIEIPNEQ